MRLVFKILALPFVLITGILYLVCKFLVVSSGAVLGILSGIIFLASLVLFFTAGLWAGLSWLVIAFLISPYGLPMAAAWLVGMIGGVNGALKDFVIWVNKFQRAQDAAPLFFCNRAVCHGSFFDWRDLIERHNTSLFSFGRLCAGAWGVRPVPRFPQGKYGL